MFIPSFAIVLSLSFLSLCKGYSKHIKNNKFFISQTGLYSNKLPYTNSDSSKFFIKRSLLITSSLIIPNILSLISSANELSSQSIGDINVEYDSVSKPVKDYLGSKATLIVNVASQCALTPQYEELVELYDKYNSKGFQILAFPSNQFGSQEPDEVVKIRQDMLSKFNVKFPIFDKIDVNGAFSHPLYQALKSVSNIGVSNISKISWNFEKFLIDKDGIPVRRYKPGIRPLAIENDIKSLVEKGLLPERKRTTLNDYAS